MRIGIIGGGSIGLLFASYLSLTFSVTIYTRTRHQAEKINRDGLWVKKHDGERCCKVRAFPFEMWKGEEDLTMITVKQYQLDSVLQKISEPTVSKGPLLFLQNGMGHLDALNQLINENVFVGSVEHGALRSNENTVSHNGVGVTKVAVYNGDSRYLDSLHLALPTEFPFVIEENYYQMLIKKLIVNTMINPLTAILQVKNGQLVENPKYFHAFRELFAELVEVLQLENSDEYWKHVLSVCSNTSQNQSSMLKDILYHRQTEVDAILGYVLKEANKTGCKAPLIRSYYYLIKGKEFEGRTDVVD